MNDLHKFYGLSCIIDRHGDPKFYYLYDRDKEKEITYEEFVDLLLKIMRKERLK